MKIREASATDSQSIADIYNYYIRESVITFEEIEISAADVDRRLAEVAAYNLPWLVIEENDAIKGYAYATQWNKRAAYRQTVEISIYLAHQAIGQGLGNQLYQALFAQLRTKPLHIVIGGVTLPNPASVALHEKFGMKKVAHFEQVGYKFEQWLDVGYWQVSL